MESQLIVPIAAGGVAILITVGLLLYTVIPSNPTYVPPTYGGSKRQKTRRRK